MLSLGWAAISWIEHYLVHGPGDVQGAPIELDDEYAAFVIKAYEVHPETGARLVRRGFISRAKGRAKSELAAMMACYEALGPCRFDHWAVEGEVSEWGYRYEVGEPVGKPIKYVEVLCVATEENQAGNTYDNIAYMLGSESCSDALAEDYPGIDVGLTRVILPDARGSIEPVSSADSSKDGGKSTFVVADETHLWILPRLKRLHSTMTRNLLKRRLASGWMLETSTMYGAGEKSVAEGTHDYAKSSRRSALLFDHQQASEHWDLEDREQRLKALAESYGPAAAWMDLEPIADYWDDPQESHAAFRRYFLNQPVPMVVEDVTPGVISPSDWQKNLVPDAGMVGTPSLVLDASPMLTRAAIVAAGASTVEGRTHIEITGSKGVLDSRPGTQWAIDLLGSNGAEVAVVAGSAAESLVPKLEEAGAYVTVMSHADYAAACVRFVAAVTAGLVTQRGQRDLDEAVPTGVKRTADEGLWIWGRIKSGSDITALVGATAAFALAESAANAPFGVW